MKTVTQKSNKRLVPIGVKFVEDCISRGSFIVQGNEYRPKAYKVPQKLVYAARPIGRRIQARELDPAPAQEDIRRMVERERQRLQEDAALMNAFAAIDDDAVRPIR